MQKKVDTEHLAIGIVEGFVTTAVVSFVWKARPDILAMVAASKPVEHLTLKNVLQGCLWLQSSPEAFCPGLLRAIRMVCLQEGGRKDRACQTTRRG